MSNLEHHNPLPEPSSASTIETLKGNFWVLAGMVVGGPLGLLAYTMHWI